MSNYLGTIVFKNGKEIQVSKNVIDRLAKGIERFDTDFEILPFLSIKSENENEGILIINPNDISYIDYCSHNIK